jgi:hypothetical protein
VDAWEAPLKLFWHKSLTAVVHSEGLIAVVTTTHGILASIMYGDQLFA